MVDSIQREATPGEDIEGTVDHPITVSILNDGFRRLRMSAGAWRHKVEFAEYERSAQNKIQNLYERLVSGDYQFQPLSIVSVSRTNGLQRPISIPMLEDKIVQIVVADLLNAIFDQDLRDCAYDHRQGCNQLQALKEVRRVICARPTDWILQWDISSYTADTLRESLAVVAEKRVRDAGLFRLVKEWITTGVIEYGNLIKSKTWTGPVQPVSLFLANLYISEVLDCWFKDMARPHLSGEAYEIRMAGDAILCFERKADAEKLMTVLPKRFEKCGLTLYGAKPLLIEFGRGAEASAKIHNRRPESLDFLGFTFQLVNSGEGKPAVQVRPSSAPEPKLPVNNEAVLPGTSQTPRLDVQSALSPVPSRPAPQIGAFSLEDEWEFAERDSGKSREAQTAPLLGGGSITTPPAPESSLIFDTRQTGGSQESATRGQSEVPVAERKRSSEDTVASTEPEGDRPEGDSFEVGNVRSADSAPAPSKLAEEILPSSEPTSSATSETSQLAILHEIAHIDQSKPTPLPAPANAASEASPRADHSSLQKESTQPIESASWTAEVDTPKVPLHDSEEYQAHQQTGSNPPVLVKDPPAKEASSALKARHSKAEEKETTPTAPASLPTIAIPNQISASAILANSDSETDSQVADMARSEGAPSPVQDAPAASGPNDCVLPPGSAPPKKTPATSLLKVELSDLVIHPKVEEILRELGFWDTWHSLWQKQGKGKPLLKQKGAELILDTTEFQVVADGGVYLSYSETWALRQIHRAGSKKASVRIALHSTVSSQEVRQRVIAEYVLRPILDRVPPKKDWLDRIIEPLKKIEKTGLIAEVTLKSFADWLHSSVSTMSNRKKRN